MPPLYDAGSTRPRIKGTDPRLGEIVDRIGRGYLPNRQPTGRDRMTADMQAEMAGRRPSDADVNDDFARRLGAQFPPDDQVKPGHHQYTHETDIGNMESIRREGIRPSTGGSNFGDPRPQVYGSRANSVEDVPEGRLRVRYQAPDEDIIGHGVGSNAISTRGPVAPHNIMSGYTSAGRVFDKGSSITGLYSLVSSLLPQYLPQIYGPTDWVLQDVMRQNYGPGGVMDPYRDYEGPRDPQTGAILA